MQVRILRWQELEEAVKHRLLSRAETEIHDAIDSVKPILEAVKERGDIALREFTLRFDKVNLNNLPLRVQPEEFEQASRILPPNVKEALEFVIENVTTFHRNQLPPSFTFTEVRPGVFAGERATPIPSVGLYVPRGKGSFPSMLYMLAVPAKIAQVPEIRIVTPPNPDGSVDPACLYAASRIGVHEVYRVGGAQGIAALAYGTQSIQRVVKILGPGSRFVSAAKRLVSSFMDVGMPAGPSEAIILADEKANPQLVALDLLIEAEHGSDSAAILITPDSTLAKEVAGILTQRMATIPEPRRTFITHVFQTYGGIILTDTMEEAVYVVNAFAPEHLQLQVEHPFDLLGQLHHAGEILLGSRTPFSVANYATGANAVLPTGGFARTYSAVSVRDFLKYTSIVQVTPKGFTSLKKHVQVLAEYEGFPSHAQAVIERTSLGSYPETLFQEHGPVKPRG
ncbi:MAG: histidinol dehydrogenase [Spirochaetes bacterium]|nr:histidinol dehydrogenase [Spirochaetota bacterium]